MFFFGQKYLAKESEEKWPNNHINKLTKTALCNLKKGYKIPISNWLRNWMSRKVSLLQCSSFRTPQIISWISLTHLKSSLGILTGTQKSQSFWWFGTQYRHLRSSVSDLFSKSYLSVLRVLSDILALFLGARCWPKISYISVYIEKQTQNLFSHTGPQLIDAVVLFYCF